VRVELNYTTFIDKCTAICWPSGCTYRPLSNYLPNI